MKVRHQLAGIKMIAKKLPQFASSFGQLEKKLDGRSLYARWWIKNDCQDVRFIKMA